MKLSVIIVNYNIKFFLEQCLNSIFDALTKIEAEVIVVDNNSVDGSPLLVKEKFPNVILISNDKNVGFSKANNQAIKIAKGEYILLLNPDTIVKNDTFDKCIDFIEKTSNVGSLGVKMFDGSGRYLPESKRGLPTPWISFCKILGLGNIFPNSSLFNAYYMGHLSNEEINKVDVLSGAFMMIPKIVLDEVGLLDETFFMYGEDIDLSYRISIAGYDNYYFPETQIIHYKGESTKKASFNYVKHFYQAMLIFNKKHFAKRNTFVFDSLIKLSIIFRAFLAIINRFVNKIILPLIDIILIYTGMFIIKEYWEYNIKYIEGGHYPPELINIIFPGCISIWLLSLFVSGAYLKPLKIKKTIKGIFWGSIIIMLGYSFLNESLRFSRAIILLSCLWTFVAILLSRFALHYLKLFNVVVEMRKNNKIFIIGDKEESLRISSFLKQTAYNYSYIGSAFELIGDDIKVEKSEEVTLSKINEIIKIYNINLVIFCLKNFQHDQIIKLMSNIENKSVEFKIAHRDEDMLIGSNSVNIIKDLFVIEISSISNSENKLYKRALDFLISFSIIVLLPFLIWFFRDKKQLFSNIVKIVRGNISFVGYNTQYENDNFLPSIKKGIFATTDTIDSGIINKEIAKNLNLLYARDYKLFVDLFIIYKNFFQLDRNSK